MTSSRSPASAAPTKHPNRTDAIAILTRPPHDVQPEPSPFDGWWPTIGVVAGVVSFAFGMGAAVAGGGVARLLAVGAAFAGIAAGASARKLANGPVHWSSTREPEPLGGPAPSPFADLAGDPPPTAATPLPDWFAVPPPEAATDVLDLSDLAQPPPGGDAAGLEGGRFPTHGPGPSTAVRDPATGLLSKEAFEAWLPTRLAASRRTLRPMALVLLESRGAPGDVALLASLARGNDLVFRLSGNRYAIVCEDGPAAAAAAGARRLLATGRVGTWSAGVAGYPDDAFSQPELLAQAERTLTRALAGAPGTVETA